MDVLVVGQVVQGGVDLCALAGQLGDRAADGGAVHDLDVGEDDVDVDVERTRDGADDGLVHVAREVVEAHEHLAGLERHDGAVLGHEVVHAREARRGRDELAGKVVLGRRENLEHVAGLDDAAALHDGHVVADLLHDVHLVGDDHHGKAQLTVEAPEQGEDGVSGLRVQGARRLVAQQHTRVGGKSTGDGHALLLAAGKLLGVGRGLVGQLDEPEQLGHASLPRLVGKPRLGQRERHVVGDGAAGEQVEMLEDDADVCTSGTQFGVGQRGDVAAVDGDGARRGALEQVDAAHERRLAGARVADDAKDLALGDGQRHVVHGA